MGNVRAILIGALVCFFIQIVLFWIDLSYVHLRKQLYYKKNKSTVFSCQVIPGNDQNTIPTNHGVTGSKLDWTSWLTFYGSRGNLKSFSRDFLV